MNLLIWTDSESLVAYLNEDTEKYAPMNVSTHFIDQLEDIYTFDSSPYFFVLSVFRADFISEYVSNTHWVNTVRVHALPSDHEKLKNYLDSDIPDSIVNRSTLYFDVFLPIEKGISISDIRSVNLYKRIDTISKFNTHIAYFLDEKKKPFYLLNYKGDVDIDYIKKLISKLK